MKIFRRFFAAYLLILTLSFSALAGDISTPLAPPQPNLTPVTTEGEMQNGVAGYIPNGGSEAAASDDSVAAAVLGLVQSVLSLL